MSTTILPDPGQRSISRSGSTTVGVLLIIAGTAGILLPFFAGVAITAVVGWLLLLAGIAHIYFGWHARSTGAAVWQALIGLLYLVVAFYLILHPASALLTLTLLLASYFVVEGIVELVLYFRLRKRHGVSWFLVDGLLTLFLGVLIWSRWPFSSAWALGTLVGISLIMSGIARVSFRHGPPLLGAMGPA